MSRFRTSRYREVPMLNTSSLPDLIFTILFFFMLVTHGQPFKQMAKVELPTAAELQKLEEKSLVIYIVVSSKAGEMSDAPVVQLNSDEVSLENLPAALETARQAVAEDERNQLIVILKADKNIPMGMINDIKTAVRKADLQTIYYSAIFAQ